MEAGDQAAASDERGAAMSVWWRGDAARRFDGALLAALVVLVAALVGLSGSSIGAVTARTVSRVEVAGGRYAVEVRRDVAYGPLPEERLDLCRPVGAAGARPGVLLIHGGGWRSGGRGQFAAECALLASRGFVAATIDYRLAPRNRWPAQLVDAQLAVRYLRAQRAALGLDAGRLCAWGESAGGHLAAFLGVLAG
ncbi:MAG TPA: alpha/beta hydrolase, partial [Ktedonobacterales bacterium]|nr:alpha/beta hydrolase [Ktedonobacterales bacterium]